MQTTHVLVLGAGTGAGYFCSEIQALGCEPGEVTVIGEEPVAPYERPALSKAYLFPFGVEGHAPTRLPAFHTIVATANGSAHDRNWYGGNGIRLITGTRVVGVDLNKRTATGVSTTTGDKTTFSFEHLVVATGQRERKLEVEGSDAVGIFHLRSEATASRVVERLVTITKNDGKAKWRPSDSGVKRAVIVGGSYLAVETATALAGWGFDEVAMIMMGDKLLPRSPWPRDIKDKFQEAVLEQGKPSLKLIKSVSVEKFIKDADGVVRKVVIDDGGDGTGPSILEMDCDIVMVCIGARPNGTELFTPANESSLLELTPSGALVVDSAMRTTHSSKTVWAIGEVARPDLGVDGSRKMGRAAARNVFVAMHAGKSKKTSHLVETPVDLSKVFHYSRIFEYTEQPLRWETVGNLAPTANVQIATFGDLDGPISKGMGAFWFDIQTKEITSSLLCAHATNYMELFLMVRKAVETGWNLDDALGKIQPLLRGS